MQSSSYIDAIYVGKNYHTVHNLCMHIVAKKDSNLTTIVTVILTGAVVSFKAEIMCTMHEHNNNIIFFKIGACVDVNL